MAGASESETAGNMASLRQVEGKIYNETTGSKNGIAATLVGEAQTGGRSLNCKCRLFSSRKDRRLVGRGRS